jgi:hypothetical protein
MRAKIEYRRGEGDPTFPIGLRVELDLTPPHLASSLYIDKNSL